MRGKLCGVEVKVIVAKIVLIVWTWHYPATYVAQKRYSHPMSFYLLRHQPLSNAIRKRFFDSGYQIHRCTAVAVEKGAALIIVVHYKAALNCHVCCKNKIVQYPTLY